MKNELSPGFIDTDEYLSVYDLSSTLCMCINTVYALCRKGVIPAKKVGRQWRISRQEFERSMIGRGTL